MKLKEFRINLYELIYLAFFSLYVFITILDASLITLGMIKTLINYATVGGLAILFVLKEPSQRHLKICGMLLVFVIASLSTDRLYIIVYMMFLITAKFSSLRKIINVSFIVTALSVLFVIFCCKVNIIPDLVYMRDGVANAHSYGFGHYSSISYYSMYMTLMWMYLRNKELGYIELAIIAVLNYGVYLFTTTRLTMYIVIMLLAIYIMIEKLDLIKISSKLIVFLSTIGFTVAFIGCVVLDILFDPLTSSPDSFLYKLDISLNSRLSMGHKALTLYSPKLFGQHIEMVGQKTIVFGDSNSEYFYIDSGYIYAFLGYGIIFTAIVIFMYTFIIRDTAKKGNTVLFIWAFSVMLFSIVNNAWISIVYNPLLFYIVLPEKKYSLKRISYMLEKKFKIKIKI